MVRSGEDKDDGSRPPTGHVAGRPGGMRGAQPQNEVGESRSYDIVIFQDFGDEGVLGRIEPFITETSDGAGFALDDENTHIAAMEFSELTEVLEVTIHTINATYAVTVTQRGHHDTERQHVHRDHYRPGREPTCAQVLDQQRTGRCVLGL